MNLAQAKLRREDSLWRGVEMEEDIKGHNSEKGPRNHTCLTTLVHVCTLVSVLVSILMSLRICQ